MQVRLPIPRLGGKLKCVCGLCTVKLNAQTSIEDEARAVAQVDRAVHARELAAARTESHFRPPADVADLAEDEGHPLAQNIEAA